MKALNTLNILDSIIPISRFNKGEANKIFSDVKKFGTKIVVKNNVPECILMSPQSYQQMMEEYEDAILAAEASKRLSEKTEYTTQDNLMKKFGLTESDLDDIEVNLEQLMEWKIKYHPLAEEELSKLDGSVRKIVLKGILKVSAQAFALYTNFLKMKKHTKCTFLQFPSVQIMKPMIQLEKENSARPGLQPGLEGRSPLLADGALAKPWKAGF